ncbi:hypothetical protein [Streptomyces sp. NBC_00057]|uniref:hypothetical protein n=1 Tax=Streptomyces sp. NBC_00057 TaxID=2975634 RepID=UPI00325597FA
MTEHTLDGRLPTGAPIRPLLSAEYGGGLRARLAALDTASDAHAQEQWPDNTTLAYRADWKTWTAFCTQLQIPATAATRGTPTGRATA